MYRSSVLSVFPPRFTIQARRVPATAICVTPPPVLVESAPHVPLPLTSAALRVRTFQTKTLVHVEPPSTAYATRGPSIAIDSIHPFVFLTWATGPGAAEAGSARASSRAESATMRTRRSSGRRSKNP